MNRPPVLLVPGWSDRPRVFATLIARFVDAGWPHVEAVEFEDRYGSNDDHAHEIRAHAERVLSEAGASELDVVAHSMGGLAVRRLLAFESVDFVRRVAFLATPHRGTWSAYLAWGGGGREMRPGSRFLRGLTRPPEVPCMTLYAAFDTHVVPGSSALWEHSQNRRIVTGHRTILKNRRAFEALMQFLSEETDGTSETDADPRPS